jgi:hypothetical protein
MLAMRFGVAAEVEEHIQVRDFMDISDQEAINIKVSIQGNLGAGRIFLTRKIPDFGKPAFCDF